MKEPSYEKKGIINDCVQKALNTNSHEAIADILVQKKLWTGRVFSGKLLATAKKKMEKQGIVCNGTKDVTKYILSFPIINDGWGIGINNGKVSITEYQRQTMRKWIHGEIVPSREAVIQLCLWMALTVEESDNLLRAAGYSALYCVDALDIVTKYYLRKFQGLPKLSKKQFIKVRAGHTKVAGWLPGIDNYGKKQCEVDKKQLQEIRALETKKTKKKTYYIDKSSRIYYEIKNEHTVIKYYYKGKKPIYCKKVTGYLGENIKQFIGEGKQKNAKDIAMTQYMEDVMGKNMGSEEEFFNFVHEHIKYLGQLHYGFLQAMQEYMNTPKYYKKNVYAYTGEFSLEDEGEILEKSSIEGEIIGGAEELLEKDNEKSREDVITKVLSLEYKHLDVLHVESKQIDKGEYSNICNLFCGRKEKNPINGEEGYVYNHPNKVKLAKLLIAMGREDEIGKMMKRAGYWDRDWICEENAEQCDYLDTSDWIIIYMIRFRDALLEGWAKKQGKNKLTFCNQNRGKFPFHRLMLEVSEYVTKEMGKKMNKKYEKERIEKYFPIYNEKKSRGCKEA